MNEAFLLKLAFKDCISSGKSIVSQTLNIYKYAHDYAIERDIIFADTKLEFGFIDGKLSLIDELLTPDSSRFWDLHGYSPGKTQPNYDKQFVQLNVHKKNAKIVSKKKSG